MTVNRHVNTAESTSVVSSSSHSFKPPDSYTVVTSIDCAYDIPSRRPNSLAHHARQLEDRLRIVQSLLKSVNLDLNIDYSQSASALPLSGNPSVHNLRPVPRIASPTILGRRNAEVRCFRRSLYLHKVSI